MGVLLIAELIVPIALTHAPITSITWLIIIHQSLISHLGLVYSTITFKRSK
jgi:hypothetical protein